MNKKQLFLSIEKKLNENTLSKYQALDVAEGLFFLIQNDYESEKANLNELQSKFLEILNRSSILDLIQSQMNYAIKIADSPGELLYEEMHKLFSLCDTIYTLEYLGLNSDNHLKESYEKSIKMRFMREKKKAKMVAEDKLEDRKIDFWWYKEPLSF
jgi:hypothetical protein